MTRLRAPGTVLATCLALAGCGTPQPPAQVPTLPATAAETPERNRAELDIFVTTRIVALRADIDRGGGGSLSRAMDLAGVPADKRPILLQQLYAQRLLYAYSPGALAQALWSWGG